MTLDGDAWRRLLRGALSVLSVGAHPGASVTTWMGDNVDGVNVLQEVARERAHRRAAVWHAERSERLRILRVMQRPVRAPVQR